MSQETVVSSIPSCAMPGCQNSKAYADAAVPSYGNSWAFVCRGCFNKYGCRLGTGKGQKLILSNPPSTFNSPIREDR
mgnify:FL=1